MYIPKRKYASLYVREVYVFSEDIVSTVIKIWDLNDGSEIDSINVDIVVGFNVISIEKEYPANWQDMEIFIGIDGNGLIL